MEPEKSMGRMEGREVVVVGRDDLGEESERGGRNKTNLSGRCGEPGRLHTTHPIEFSSGFTECLPIRTHLRRTLNCIHD